MRYLFAGLLGAAIGATATTAHFLWTDQPELNQAVGPVLYQKPYDPDHMVMPRSLADPDGDGWVDIRPAGPPSTKPDPGEPFTSVQP